MLYKGMVSKSKYWISEKIRVMSTQKRRKNPYARVLVLCQVPLEIKMRVNQISISCRKELCSALYSFLHRFFPEALPLTKSNEFSSNFLYPILL